MKFIRNISKLRCLIIIVCVLFTFGFVEYQNIITVKLENEQIRNMLLKHSDSSIIDIIKKELYEDYCFVLYNDESEMNLFILKETWISGRYEYYGKATQIKEDDIGLNYGVYKTGVIRHKGTEMMTIVFGNNTKLKAKELLLGYSNKVIKYEIPQKVYFIIPDTNWASEFGSPEIKWK